MAAPRFVAASTGATDAGGAWTATCHAPGAAGRLIIVQILQDGDAYNDVAVTGATNITSIEGTSNSWTWLREITSDDLDVPFIFPTTQVAGQRLYLGRSTSTSAPTISGTNVGSQDLYWRFYEFSDVSTGTTLATVIENAAGTLNVTADETLKVAISTGTSSTASDASVQTSGSDRLALNFVAVNDDNAIARFSGATGGDWVEVAEYAESSGTDGAIQLQWAYVGPANTEGGSLNYVYGGTGTSEELAQSFTPSASVTIGSVLLYVGAQASPADDLIVELRSDSSGVPSETVIASDSVSGAQSGYTSFYLPASLTADTQYWVVARRSGSRSTSNYWTLAGAPSNYGRYSAGAQAVRSNGTWYVDGNDRDLVFAVPIAGTIDGGSASITDIDAWGVVGFALLPYVAPAAGGAPPFRRRPAHHVYR